MNQRFKVLLVVAPTIVLLGCTRKTSTPFSTTTPSVTPAPPLAPTSSLSSSSPKVVVSPKLSPSPTSSDANTTRATSENQKLSIEVPDGWKWSAKDHSIRIENDGYKSQMIIEYGKAGKFLTEQEGGGAIGDPSFVGTAIIAGKKVNKFKLMMQNKVTMFYFSEPSDAMGVPIKIGSNILRVEAPVNPELPPAVLAKVEAVVDQVAKSIRLIE